MKKLIDKLDIQKICGQDLLDIIDLTGVTFVVRSTHCLNKF